MALRIHPSPIRANMGHLKSQACGSKSGRSLCSVAANCFMKQQQQQQQQQQKKNGRVGLPGPSDPLRTAEEIASCLGLEMAIADLERLYRKGGSSSSSIIPDFGGEEPPADAAAHDRRRRRPVRVAYQGVRGSYCQEAAVKAISPIIFSCDSFPCTNMEDAFSALEDRSADRAVIPAENSIDGPIDRNLDLLLRHGSVQIVGELVVPVNHCLLSLPGAPTSALRRIVSHPQALSHCSGRLEALHLDLDLEVEEVSSAADAARFVAENQITDTAVIGSEIAAQEFGLQVLERNFQDRTAAPNFNRFLQLGLDAAGSSELVKGVGVQGGRQKKTTVAFSLLKGVTDLFRAMCIFERHGLRVTRIDHRPNRSNPLRSVHRHSKEGGVTSYLDYVFVLDLEASSGTCGHSSTEESSQVKASLAHLSDISGFARVLGSYYTSTCC